MSHILFGLANVLVTPIGLVLEGFVQSANRYQYFVSAFNPVASTLTVKSTSYDVKASPESIGEPDREGDGKTLYDTQTGTL